MMTLARQGGWEEQQCCEAGRIGTSILLNVHTCAVGGWSMAAQRILLVGLSFACGGEDTCIAPRCLERERAWSSFSRSRSFIGICRFRDATISGDARIVTERGVRRD